MARAAATSTTHKVIRIEDAADPRISAYLDVRERDLVGRRSLFIAEGKVVLESLIGSDRFRPHSLLIAERKIDGLQPLLAQVPGEVPVYAAAQGVVDTIAGFPLHRGILAIAERSNPVSAQTLLAGLPARAVVIMLSGIANHDNMGGLFRNAAAFGVDAMLVDSSCCDPLYRKAIRVSAGAVLRMPFARLAKDDDPLAVLASHGFATFALSPEGELPLSCLDPPERTALVFGAEGSGLPRALIDRTVSVRIPMAHGTDSLNVATTSGIVLHHVAEMRDRPQAGRKFSATPFMQ